MSHINATRYTMMMMTMTTTMTMLDRMHVRCKDHHEERAFAEVDLFVLRYARIVFFSLTLLPSFVCMYVSLARRGTRNTEQNG